MCTLFLAVNRHPKYPLIFIGTRDEFYKRKSNPMDWWPGKKLLAGRDLEQGGTWFGVNPKGDWAAVTNFRDLKNEYQGNQSRGHLIPKIIENGMNRQEAMHFLKTHAGDFRPFNLLYSIDGNIYYFSSVRTEGHQLKDGIYGLSNAYLDTPWFKVKYGKERFEKIISGPDYTKEALFELMRSRKQAPEEELPDTGLDSEMEKAVSSLFIKTPDYGTNCITFFVKDKNGSGFVEERRVDGKNSMFNLWEQ